MQFSEIVGQQRLKKDLVQLANGGRMPHALLLLGKEGVGGLPIALAFAQYIFCSGTKREDSCGNCPACQKVAKLEHADLHLSFPAIPPKPSTKALSRYYIQAFRKFISGQPYGTTFDWLQHIEAENKQGNIPAEECREILEALNLKSYEGGYKIQIIWRPEYLGKEGNILLKLIEEPPSDTLIIFVAEEVESILPTIRSRTQLVRIPPIAAEDIAAALTQKNIATGRAAAQIGQLAGGSFTAALQLVAHLGNDLLPQVRDWFNAIFTNNGLALARFTEAWAKEGREQQKHFFRYVLELLEGATRAAYLPLSSLPLPEDELAFISRLSGRKFHPDTLTELTDAISESLYFIERNGAPRLQMLTLSIRLMRIIKAHVAAPANAA